MHCVRKERAIYLVHDYNYKQTMNLGPDQVMGVSIEGLEILDNENLGIIIDHSKSTTNFAFLSFKLDPFGEVTLCIGGSYPTPQYETLAMITELHTSFQYIMLLDFTLIYQYNINSHNHYDIIMTIYSYRK